MTVRPILPLEAILPIDLLDPDGWRRFGVEQDAWQAAHQAKLGELEAAAPLVQAMVGELLRQYLERQ